MKITILIIQGFQGLVRRQGGMQNNPRPTFESLCQVSGGEFHSFFDSYQNHDCEQSIIIDPIYANKR